MYREFEFQNPLGQNACSLQTILNQKLQQLRAEIANHGDAGYRSMEEYVQSRVQKYTIHIPRFDFTNIGKKLGSTDSRDMFNRSIMVPVVTFTVPFSGEIEYLKYIPRGGVSLPRYHFSRYDQSLSFDVISPNKDVETTSREKEQALAFLQERLEAAHPELEEYNQRLEATTASFIEQQKKRDDNDEDFLSKL